jgi:hypothetical protein
VNRTPRQNSRTKIINIHFKPPDTRKAYTSQQETFAPAIFRLDCMQYSNVGEVAAESRRTVTFVEM